jgi:hypothetical protein
VSHVVQPVSTDPGYAEAVAEEARSYDDILDESDLELAPVFTPEDLDFSDYRWNRGDQRSRRELNMYQAGHRARDFQ